MVRVPLTIYPGALAVQQLPGGGTAGLPAVPAGMESNPFAASSSTFGIAADTLASSAVSTTLAVGSSAKIDRGIWSQQGQQMAETARKMLPSVVRSFGVLAASSVLPTNTTIEDVKKAALMNLGRTVKRSKLPKLYSHAERIVARLGDAFNKFNTSGVTVDNKIEIVDSEMVNATVFQLVGRSKVHRTNHVYVTTGMLNKLFSADGKFTPESIERGQYLLAGILAHELAHPRDRLDAGGLEERYGWTLSYQARELRADIEAILLLREARLPTSALLDALEVIFDRNKERDSTLAGAISAGVSTHPEDDLRLSVLQDFLTFDDFEHGDGEVEPIPLPPVKAVCAELKHMPMKSKKEEIVFPQTQTILETIEALNKYRTDNQLRTNSRAGMGFDQWDKHNKIKINYFLVRLDKMLIEKGDKLTEDEIAAVLDLNEFMLHMSTQDIVFHSSTDRKEDVEQIGGTIHLDLIYKIPFYHTKRYEDWLRGQFVKDKSGNLGEFRFIAPARTVFKVATSELKETLLDASHKGYAVFFHEVFERLETKDDSQTGVTKEWKLVRAAWFHENIMPELRPSILVPAFLMNFNETGLFPENFALGEKRSYSMADTGSLVKILEAPFYDGLKISYEKIARHIWENRGLYGILEYQKGRIYLDWELIFHLLKIDMEKGYAEVESAVKEFTRTQKYVDVLKILSEPENFERPPHEVMTFSNTTLPFSLPSWAKKWARSDLYPYLSGEHNEYIEKGGKLHLLAKRFIAGNYLMSDGEKYVKYYGDALRRRFDHAAWSKDAEALFLLHEEAVKEITNAWEKHKLPSHVFDNLEDVWVTVIEDADAPREKKQDLLRDIFIERYDAIRRRRPDCYNTSDFTVESWMELKRHGTEDKRDGIKETVCSTLIRLGVIRDMTDLVLQIRDVYIKKSDPTFIEKNPGDYPFKTYYNNYDKNEAIQLIRTRYASTFFDALEDVHVELMKEIRLAQTITDQRLKREALFRLLDIADPFEWGYDPKGITGPSNKNARTVRAVKNVIIELAGTLDMSTEEKLGLFERLTATGPTAETDGYLRDHILTFKEGRPSNRNEVEGIKGCAREEARKRIEPLLEDKRVQGRTLQAGMARFVLEPLLTRDAGRSKEGLSKVIELAEKYVPSKSIASDELLEEVAWRCGVESDLIQIIEDAKGTNWRNIHPLTVHAASVSSEWAGNLTDEERVDMIRYIMEPGGEPLPASVVNALRRTWQDELHHQVLTKLQDLAIMINDLHPIERIPLITLLLNKGEPSFMDRPDFPLNISRLILGYGPASSEEKMLIAALKSIPAEKSYQRPVVLAYLMSTSGEEKSGVRAIFEAFTAVGISLGQKAAIFWENVPENVKRELNELKDMARPLTKAEILKIIDATLTPEERKRIRLIKILGSASTRTAVLVELGGRREAVMLVQRPHAETQVRSNIERVKRLIPELKKQGFTEYVEVIEAFLEAVTEQLYNELGMGKEVEMLNSAKKVYERLNDELKPILGGWKFFVPGLVEGFRARDNMLFIEKVNGVQFDALPEGEDKFHAGMGTVVSAFRSLTKYGLARSDPHKGNYLYDPKGKTIGVFDFGKDVVLNVKAGGLERDDIYDLTQFLWAIHAKDVKKILYFGQRMSGAKEFIKNGKTKAAIEEAVKNGRDFGVRLVAVVNALNISGVKLPGAFSAGAIVELMMLAKERYVDEKLFPILLILELVRAASGKFPRIITSAIARRLHDSALYTIMK